MRSIFEPAMLRHISASGVIAVLVVERVEDAVPLARALIDGGVNVMELTLRTPVAIKALQEIKAHVPEMMAGIGTILEIDQVKAVARAGAAFGVAPGVNPSIVKQAQKVGLPFAPGVATPTDIERALELGCELLKFFPAEPSGGMPYLKSIAAPYEHLNLRYVPLGGINTSNMQSYLENSMVLAVGGSWMAPQSLIQNHDWQAIAVNAGEASKMVRPIRGS